MTGLLLGPRALGLAVALAVAALAAAVGAAAALRRPRRDPQEGGGELPPLGSGTDGGFDLAAAERAALLGRSVALAVAVAVLVLAGTVLARARVAALEATALGPALGHGVRERVVLREAPRPASFGGWSALVSLRGEPVLLRVPTAPAGALPAAGAVLEVAGGLRPAGDFARVRRAHAELRAVSAVTVGRRGGLRGALDGVRARAELALDRGLPPAAAGLLRGMVLGQDAALPTATRNAFRAAGLSHLVAASGTNVVLLAALATALGSAVGLGLSGRLWFVLAFVVLYVPLAGGGPSIQRAGVMGAAAVAAGLVGRPASRWYALGLAAAVTLALDPRAAADPGWQLSFVAVLALLLLAPRWRRGLVRRGLPGPLADVTAMTAAATLATAPVVAAHFGQASLVAVPANVLAAPAVAPVMWLGVLAAAAGQLLSVGGPIGGLVAATVDALDAVAGYPLGYLSWIADVAAGAPGAVVAVGPGPVLLAVVVLGLGATVRRLRRAAAPAAALATAAWLVLGPAPRAPADVPGGFRLTFLDVGQGDATLLQDGRRSVLVDTGLPEAGVVARLRRAGVERLDLLVVTHADADHIGGAAAVLGAVPVGLVLDGRDGQATADGTAMALAAARRHVGLLAPHAGQVLRLGQLRLSVLWPRAEPAALHAGGEPNARAIVLEAEDRGVRVLLTADAESDVLSQLPLRPVDVLKVAHHGSADPGLPALLARLRPRVAGIEVGAGNSYGHPTPSTLSALAASVPVVVRTDRDGSVRLDLEPGGRWALRAHV